MISSIGETNILPSPISPHRAAKETSCTTFSTKSSSITTSITLTGHQRVAYSQIPAVFQTDVALDIDNGVTVDVTEGTVLVL